MKRIAVIGYGVIGKRVADAINLQDDMKLSGVCDIISDWRIQNAVRKEYDIYAATQEAADRGLYCQEPSIESRLPESCEKSRFIST